MVGEVDLAAVWSSNVKSEPEVTDHLNRCDVVEGFHAAMLGQRIDRLKALRTPRALPVGLELFAMALGPLGDECGARLGRDPAIRFPSRSTDAARPA